MCIYIYILELKPAEAGPPPWRKNWGGQLQQRLPKEQQK